MFMCSNVLNLFTCSGSVHFFMNLVIDMLPVLFLLLEDEDEAEEVWGVVGEFP